MIVNKLGHNYTLANTENPDEGQTLQFVEKVPPNSNRTMVLVMDGVSNEEVLDVLLDRMYYLQNTMPCKENEQVITKLQEAQMWLHKRTALRKSQDVEGFHLPHKDL